MAISGRFEKRLEAVSRSAILKRLKALENCREVIVALDLFIRILVWRKLAKVVVLHGRSNSHIGTRRLCSVGGGG